MAEASREAQANFTHKRKHHRRHFLAGLGAAAALLLVLGDGAAAAEGGSRPEFKTNHSRLQEKYDAAQTPAPEGLRFPEGKGGS